MSSPIPPRLAAQDSFSSILTSSQQQDSQSQEYPNFHFNPPSSIPDLDKSYIKTSLQLEELEDLQESSSPFNNHSQLPPPPPAPSISAALLEAIHSALTGSSDNQEDKVLSVTCEEYQSFLLELEHPTQFDGENIEKLRYDYNSEKGLLTVRCMPSGVHNAIVPFVVWMKDKMRRPDFLTSEELEWVEFLAGDSIVLPDVGSEYAGPPSSKQPDAAYRYDNPNDKELPWTCFPRVVFEVAYKSPYETGKEYAEKWLVRSQGKTKLVVVINIDESTPEYPKQKPKARSGKQSRDGGSNMNGGLARENVGGTLIEGHVDGMMGDSSREIAQPGLSSESANAKSSSLKLVAANDYEAFGIAGDHRKWVGDISGFIELYRYNEVTESVDRDGPQVKLFPEPGSGNMEAPRIRITDLINVPPSDTRSYQIPLDEYRRCIIKGVRSLAVNRKSNHDKKELKRKAEDDVQREAEEVNGREQVADPSRRPGLRRKRVRVES